MYEFIKWMMMGFAVSLIGCGANADLLARIEAQDKKIAENESQQTAKDAELRKLRSKILHTPVVAAPAATTAPVASAAPAPKAAPVAAKAAEKKPVAAPAPESVAATATPPEAPAPPPVARTAAPTKVPAILPAILPGPNDPGIANLVGFSDDNMDPCKSNAVERALTAYSPMGYPAGFHPFNRALPGQCAALRRSQYYMHVRVAGQEMVARYKGGQLVSVWSDKGGDRRLRPLVHPGERVFWVMPSGTHTVAIDLYTPGPVGDVMQYSKTVCWTRTWPATGVANPWGFYQDTVEQTLPTCNQ
jgi:hypothetical protein